MKQELNSLNKLHVLISRTNAFSTYWTSLTLYDEPAVHLLKIFKTKGQGRKENALKIYTSQKWVFQYTSMCTHL